MVCDRAVPLEAFLDVLAKRSDVRVGGATGDHKEVRHVRHAFQTEHDHVVRLVVQRDRGSALRQVRDRRGLGIMPSRGRSHYRLGPYCLITQTLISGFTSAWSRMGTRKTPSVRRGSCRSIWRFSIWKPWPSS